MPPVFKLDGLVEMRRRITGIQEGFAPKLGDALYRELQNTEQVECRAETPVDSGDLQSTVKATEPVIDKRQVTSSIVAGGYADNGNYVDYAGPVHEDMDAFHTTGGPKYIQRPMRRFAGSLLQRVARRFRW